MEQVLYSGFGQEMTKRYKEALKVYERIASEAAKIKKM